MFIECVFQLMAYALQRMHLLSAGAGDVAHSQQLITACRLTSRLQRPLTSAALTRLHAACSS